MSRNWPYDPPWLPSTISLCGQSTPGAGAGNTAWAHGFQL